MYAFSSLQLTSFSLSRCLLCHLSSLMPFYLLYAISSVQCPFISPAVSLFHQSSCQSFHLSSCLYCHMGSCNHFCLFIHMPFHLSKQLPFLSPSVCSVTVQLPVILSDQLSAQSSVCSANSIFHLSACPSIWCLSFYLSRYILFHLSSCLPFHLWCLPFTRPAVSHFISATVCFVTVQLSVPWSVQLFALLSV